MIDLGKGCLAGYAGLVIGATLLSSAATAAGPGFGIQPTEREARIRINEKHQLLAGMTAARGGTPKSDPNPSEELACDLPHRSVDAPAAPGGFDGASFVRFLQMGLDQSYNKSYQDGWNILHTTVKKALTCGGDLPLGVSLTLGAGRDASYEKDWKTAYEVLHETMKAVANDPQPLAGGAGTFFPAYLRVARQCSYEKSWENGWKIMHTFYKNLEGQGAQLIPSPEMRFALETARNAAYNKSWQAAYQVLHVAAKHMEPMPTGPRPLYEMALQCSYEKSWQEGYQVLRTFIEKLIASGMMAPFDKVALETTLESSYNKNWEPAYQILKTGISALLK